MPANYHTHTPLCQHAEGEPEEYVDAAIAAGWSEYGISDHAPLRPEPFDDWRMLERDLPTYFEWIERARKHAAGRLPIRAGLECDWLEGCNEWIADLASRYEWDYLIGSVHYLDDWDFDNPKWVGSAWVDMDIDDVWERYWATYSRMADSGLFDILAHPDLIKKFGYRPKGNLVRFYEPAINAIAASGCTIELNTSGWHRPAQEAFPSSEFLELACSAGIPVVISTDAHSPKEVGRDMQRGIELVKSVGFSETQLFEKRERRSESLG